MNDAMQYPNGDDGYSGSLTNGGRLIKGQHLRWNETSGWHDRDGLKPPEIMVAVAVSEALQCWKAKKSIDQITEKPLPRVKDLNEAIPVAEWEIGLDGKPKPPWQHHVLVYLVDPASGGFYTYSHSTIGAHIAVDRLKERVTTMRALRGARIVPVVKLSQGPMRTSYGVKSRPEFEIIEYRQWGGDGAVTGPQAPQLSGPASEATQEKTPEVKPEAKSGSQPKPADQTLASMDAVKPVTAAEFVNDENLW